MLLPAVVMSCVVVCLAMGPSPKGQESHGMKQASVSYVPKGCFWDPKPGTCRDYTRRYFFNTTSGRCEQFIYSGCGGNWNNFITLIDCHKTCTCNVPPQTGPCRGHMRSWFFSPAVGGCRPFVYGGCGGNANRYGSWVECSNACGYPASQSNGWKRAWNGRDWNKGSNATSPRKGYIRDDFIHDWMLLGRLGEGAEFNMESIWDLMLQLRLMGGLSTMKGAASGQRGGASGTTGTGGMSAGSSRGTAGSIGTGERWTQAGSTQNRVEDVAALMAIFGQEMEMEGLMPMLTAYQAMNKDMGLANNAHTKWGATAHGSGRGSPQRGWGTAGQSHAGSPLGAYGDNGNGDYNGMASRGWRQGQSATGYRSNRHSHSQTGSSGTGLQGTSSAWTGTSRSGARITPIGHVRGSDVSRGGVVRGVSRVAGNSGFARGEFTGLGNTDAAPNKGKFGFNGSGRWWPHAGEGNRGPGPFQAGGSRSWFHGKKGGTGPTNGAASHGSVFRKPLLDGTFGNKGTGEYILKLIRQFGSGKLLPSHLNALARRFGALKADGSLNTNILARRLIGSMTGTSSLADLKGNGASIASGTLNAQGNMAIKIVLDQLKNAIKTAANRASGGGATGSRHGLTWNKANTAIGTVGEVGTFGNKGIGEYILKLIRQFGSGKLLPSHLNALARRFGALKADGSVNTNILARRLIGYMTGTSSLADLKGNGASIASGTLNAQGNMAIKIVLDQLKNAIRTAANRASGGGATGSRHGLTWNKANTAIGTVGEVGTRSSETGGGGRGSYGK